MIPLLIHQSWKTESIPYDVYPQSWVDSWKQHHPTWDHILWTDEDNDALVRNHYPQFLLGYEGLNPIRRADFARFLYMHRHGGLYVDLDYVCLKPHDDLFRKGFIFLSQLTDIPDAYYQIHNAWMASEPGNDFWLHCAEDALACPDNERRFSEQHTGPLRVQWAAAKYAPFRLHILPSNLVCPIDWHRLYSRIHFSLDQYELNRTLKDLPPQEMSAHIPDAYAVTFWKHNWSE